MKRKVKLFIIILLVVFICPIKANVFATENTKSDSNIENKNMTSEEQDNKDKIINQYEEIPNYTEVYPNNQVDIGDFKTNDKWTLKFNDLGKYQIIKIAFFYKDVLYNVENWEKKYSNVDGNEYYEVTFYLPKDLIELLGGENKTMPKAYLDLHVCVRT